MARILVIDGNAGTRALLEQMLTSDGHEVVLAADSYDGIEQCRTWRAHAVIADLSGSYEHLEKLLELRQDFPEIPLVGTSAGEAGPTMRVARWLGAVALLEKPFVLPELRGVMNRALRVEKP